MTPTNYEEKCRAHRAAEKKLKAAAADMAEALRGLLATFAGPSDEVDDLACVQSARAALQKAGVTP